MKSPIHQRVNFSKEVALPSLTFQSEPHCGQCDIWLGGSVSEGSGIYLCFCYYFEQAHFVMFSGLLVFLFSEVVILYNLLFQKLHQLFFLFFLAHGLKN